MNFFFEIVMYCKRYSLVNLNQQILNVIETSCLSHSDCRSIYIIFIITPTPRQSGVDSNGSIASFCLEAFSDSYGHCVFCNCR